MHTALFIQKKKLIDTLSHEQLREYANQAVEYIEELQSKLQLALRARFAARAESYLAQGGLFDQVFNEPEVEAAKEEPTPEETAPKKRGKRRPIPENLERVRIVHDLPEEQKICPEGHALTHIGEEVSEQLDIVPARIQVLAHCHQKYACKVCEECVRTAAATPQPIPKSLASPGLLAHVIVSKYQDGLPLYRQEGILERCGIELSRQTLARWLVQSSELLQPLYAELERHLLAHSYVQMDETWLQVLREPGRLPQTRSYMWVRTQPQRGIVLYTYAPTRSASVAKALLRGFKGHLHSDGYSGYNWIEDDPDIVPIACLAHIRRKFYDAWKVKNKLTRAAPVMAKADEALALIKKIYMLERDGLRLEKGAECFALLGQWLDAHEHTFPSSSLMGQAVVYARARWAKMLRVLASAAFHLDTNYTENKIRPFVIGRKNWLFSDSPEGAAASATLYSIIETAKAHSIEPYAYLRLLLSELPKKPDSLDHLLPWNKPLA